MRNRKIEDKNKIIKAPVAEASKANDDFELEFEKIEFEKSEFEKIVKEIDNELEYLRKDLYILENKIIKNEKLKALAAYASNAKNDKSIYWQYIDLLIETL